MITKTQRWPVHSEDEITAVADVMRSGYTNYWTGTKCKDFEKEYAAYVGTKYAVALMNGTVALEAALYALDIGPEDEVITSCRTFIASASCIVMRHATPVLADIDISSQNITAKTIEPCITPRTKAIIVVHLAGWPADMKAIMALAHQYNLKVIEDCAQAHGATIDNIQVGSWGDVAAFSFCQDKILTTGGEGGMITTNDKDIWRKIWSFKDHGKNPDKIYQKDHPPGFRWLHDSFGTNWRMTEMQAVIGSVQLKKLPEWLRTRKKNASILNAKLSNIPALYITIPPDNLNHAYYKFYVLIRSEMLKSGWNRDKIMLDINKMGVPCFTGSCGDIGQEKAFKSIQLTTEHVRPIAKIIADTSLMFLVDPTYTENDMENTANAIIHVLNEATQSEAISCA